MKTKVEEKKAEVKVIVKEVAKIDPASLFKACASCHGAKGDKKALGQSDLIGTWSADKIAAALVGYKEGTYGKAMKGLMKAQSVRLSDEEIKSISKYISTLNK
ncbi:MAG: c-type cytochrome [Campylobacteraceae bacterium]|nr:c-type cytochrome [Campylobacteraceae bacterium]